MPYVLDPSHPDAGRSGYRWVPPADPLNDPLPAPAAGPPPMSYEQWVQAGRPTIGAPRRPGVADYQVMPAAPPELRDLPPGDAAAAGAELHRRIGQARGRVAALSGRLSQISDELAREEAHLRDLAGATLRRLTA